MIVRALLVAVAIVAGLAMGSGLALIVLPVVVEPHRDASLLLGVADLLAGIVLFLAVRWCARAERLWK